MPPGDAAIAAAQNAEALAKEAANNAGVAEKVAQEAFEAAIDAYGNDPDGPEYQKAEQALNEAKALKINADNALAAAANALAEAKAAKNNAAAAVEHMGTDGTAVGYGASYAVAEKAIINAPTDEGPEGTLYSALRLRSAKLTKNSVSIKWNTVTGAQKYVIYGNKCGNANKMVRLDTVIGNAITFKQIGDLKVKKGTYYKFIVLALDGNEKVVSTSKVIHVATKGGKYGNHKSVTVNKTTLNKAKNLKVGKTLKLNAKAIKAAGPKVRTHRKLKYESSNSGVATVTGKGTVKAKGKGTCYIYAYAQNGVFKKVKVVVK